MAFDDGVKTVSGSVAHTDDAATKVPFVSVKCGIEPTLSCVSSVTETQTGRNLCPNSFEQGTFSEGAPVGSDYATMKFGNTIRGRSTDIFRIDNGNVNVSCADGYQLFITLFGSDGKYLGQYVGWTTDTSITNSNSYYIAVAFKRNDNGTITDADFEAVHVMCEVGSSASTYEPYTPTQYTADLGRTIYGGQADIVNGNCEPTNWIDDTLSNLEQGSINGSTGANENANNRVRNASAIPFPYDEIASSYTWTIPSGYKVAIRPYDANGNFIQLPSWALAFITQLPQDLIGQGITQMRFVLAKTDNSAITPSDMAEVGYILNKGNTADAYSPYFAPFTFDGQEVPTRLGVNNFWSDSGDTEVTYYDNAHGFAEVTVNMCGKNVLPNIKTRGSDTRVNLGQSDDGFSLFLKKGTYTLSATTSINCRGYYRGENDGSNTLLWSTYTTDGHGTFTLSEDTNVRIWLYNGDGLAVTDVLTFMLEVGSIAHEYEPYEAVSKTAYLHKVIYGGQADVVKGTCEPKNLFDDSTFPRTATDNTYYAQFQSNLAEGNKYKIPTIHIEPDVVYVLSFDVECNTEPFNASVGIGIGSYSKDIATVTYNTSGRISVPFTLTSALKEQYGDVLSFRVPRYNTPKEFAFTISNVQLEKASTASEYAPHFEPFSFPPISISTDEGENTLFANEGDSAITYRRAVD